MMSMNVFSSVWVFFDISIAFMYINNCVFITYRVPITQANARFGARL